MDIIDKFLFGIALIITIGARITTEPIVFSTGIITIFIVKLLSY